MKKIIASLIIGVCSFIYAETNVDTEVKNTTNCEQILKSNDKELIARSGCCSWHGGVCDCAKNGRVICCDGSFSPTCLCKGGEEFKPEVVK